MTEPRPDYDYLRHLVLHDPIKRELYIRDLRSAQLRAVVSLLARFLVRLARQIFGASTRKPAAYRRPA